MIRTRFRTRPIAVLALISFCSYGAPASKPFVSELRKAAEPDAEPLNAASLTKLSLTALPDPQAESTGYAAAAVYLKRTADDANHGSSVMSALIDPRSLSVVPARLPCKSRRLAVALDIDPAGRTFDLTDPPLPERGLSGLLSELRRNGVSILWVTSLTANFEEAVNVRLEAVRLKGPGEDRVITAGISYPKQEARLIAGRELCIVAIVGDELSDFEEAFGYLKDPDGAIASSLRSNIANGWFFAPLPIQ